MIIFRVQYNSLLTSGVAIASLAASSFRSLAMAISINEKIFVQLTETNICALTQTHTVIFFENFTLENCHQNQDYPMETTEIWNYICFASNKKKRKQFCCWLDGLLLTSVKDPIEWKGRAFEKHSTPYIP